jgi:hypothetical protein
LANEFSAMAGLEDLQEARVKIPKIIIDVFISLIMFIRVIRKTDLK